MNYYKNGNGDVYAYEQHDIDIVNGIAQLEVDLNSAQEHLDSLPVPPDLPGDAEDDPHAAERKMYLEAQNAVADAQAALESIPNVFFSVREKLQTLTLMTPTEIEAHLNPPPLPTPVPEQVARAQGKAVLIQAGLWQDVLDYVGAIEDATERQLAEVALHDTTHWQRTSPFLNAAAAALGITEQQMDALFQQASEIEL